MKRSGLAILGLCLLLTAGVARGEIFVSSNDGKQRRADDKERSEPDTVSIIDVTNGKVKLLASLAAPTALTGPPTAVALTRDSRLAIVTASQKLENGVLVPNDQVSLIDLRNPSKPELLQTIEAGPGASGVSISPDGKVVLVAGAGNDSITSFTLANRKLTREGQLILEKGSGPHDIFFLPGGKRAVAVGRYNSRLMLLTVDGAILTDTGTQWVSGRNPYGGVVTRDGKYTINANLSGAFPAGDTSGGGRGGPAVGSTIGMIEVASGKLVANVPTSGPTSEHVFLSADGKYAVVVVQNGSANLIRADANFATQTGTLEVYAVGDGTLARIAQAPIGHWPQGAAMTRDGKTILVQNAYERDIQVFRFDGTTLREDAAARIPLGARPGSLGNFNNR
jgi:DNA-binding beta-propeller fold protein YncE